MTEAPIALGLLLMLSLPSAAATLSGIGNPGSAVTSAVVEEFETAAPGLYHSFTFGNVTIFGDIDRFTIGSDFGGEYNNSGQSVYNDFDLVPLSFRFEFALAVEAFAFNWGGADDNWTLSAYDVANNLLESSILAPTFAGNDGEYYGIAASGIAYATLEASNGDFVFIDNFASTKVVPAPAALTLLLGALGGLSLLRRRRA